MKLEKIEKKLAALIPTWVGEKHIPSIIRQRTKLFTNRSSTLNRKDMMTIITKSIP